jgi:hypothetical protein
MFMLASASIGVLMVDHERLCNGRTVACHALCRAAAEGYDRESRTSGQRPCPQGHAADDKARQSNAIETNTMRATTCFIV